MNNKELLVNFLLSEDYIELLERAVLARLGTSTYNVAQHTKAYELLRAYRDELIN